MSGSLRERQGRWAPLASGSLRRLRTLVRREVRATLRDPFTLVTLIAVPIVALLAFSFVLATDVRHLQLGVFDADASRASRRLVAELGAAGSFDAIAFGSREALEAALVRGEISAGIAIPPEFDAELLGRGPELAAPVVQVLYDGAETVLAGNAEAYLRALVAASTARISAREIVRLADASGSAPRAGARRSAARANPAPGVAVNAHALFNPRLEGVPFMVAGSFGFVLSFLTILITAVSIVNERLSGTFDQLQLTPATNLEILLGKLLPMGAVFTFDIVLMMGVAGLLLGVWPAGSALFFIVVSAGYVATSLSLGLIFSATSATAAEAVQKTVLFSVPLVQLSGFAFPIRNMPEPVQWLTQLFPATHYIRVTRGIYQRGEGFFELWPELLILAAFGVVLVAVALRALERRA